MLDVVIIILIIILVLENNKKFSAHYGVPFLLKQYNYLFFYHILFIILFTLYLEFSGGDALAYWIFVKFPQYRLNKGWLNYYGFGTDFILFLTYLPTQILKLQFFTG